MASATFLFCVESGHFEAQTTLAIECLRRFGGRFSNYPVLVVTPRFGPSLIPETLRKFSELDVKYIRRNHNNDYSWYPYTNKALAAKVADEEAQTDQIFWLDSDVLVVRPPEELELNENEDFAICSVDKNVGSSGPHDPFEPYWIKMSEEFGLTVDDLPWIQPLSGEDPVRFRLHSGVYSFRRGRGLGEAFFRDICIMLGSKIAFSRSIPFPGDDVALAYSIIRLGLRYRMLSMGSNFEMIPTSKVYKSSGVESASIIHYHKALTDSQQTDWFMSELTLKRPDVAEWLRLKLPLKPRIGGIFRRLLRKSLYELRNKQARRCHAASITVLPGQ